MGIKKPNDPAEKQPASSSRSNELNTSESVRVEANLRLDSPHPNSELSYSQQIKEQDKIVSNAVSKSLEPNERAANKSLEKSNELADTRKRDQEDEMEATEKRNLLQKLSANMTQSANRQPNRLSSFGNKRRNMSRYKQRRPTLRRAKPGPRSIHAWSTTPDSDDELSIDLGAPFRRRDEVKREERQRKGYDFKVHGEPKSKKKKRANLDELADRALIKYNTFKLSECNISFFFS